MRTPKRPGGKPPRDQEPEGGRAWERVRQQQIARGLPLDGHPPPRKAKKRRGRKN